MTLPSTPPRVAVLGCGVIGSRVLQLLSAHFPEVPSAVLPRKPASAPKGIEQLWSAAALKAWASQVVVECAGHEAVRLIAAPLLMAGCDVVLAFIGARGDGALRSQLQGASRSSGARPITVAGAIGGLDALTAVRLAGLDAVIYTGRKPPLAWKGTPAELSLDLLNVNVPTTVFDGSAADAAGLYPKNANVTAAVALAGIGFDRTQVRLIADPAVSRNVHELHAVGPSGDLSVRLENAPLPDNRKHRGSHFSVSRPSCASISTHRDSRTQGIHTRRTGWACLPRPSAECELSGGHFTPTTRTADYMRLVAAFLGESL